MTATKPQRAAIYCRISSDREGLELGVARQEEDCRELADSLGWALHPTRPVYVDNDKGASSLSRKPRPRWDELLAAVRAGDVDGVIYWSNSRLTRRSREYLDVIDLVQDTGVRLASVKSTQVDLTTASGRLVGKILADVDAHEAEQVSERVARRWQQRRESGQPHSTGMRAFGFGWTGTDEDGKRKDFDHDKINEVEAAAIRDAARMITDGASLGVVVRHWTKTGVRPVNGNAWSRVTVKRALTRPRVAGIIEHQGVEVGTFTDEPILDRDTWELVRKLISDRSSIVRARYRGREHLLAGFLSCGLCGHNMKISALRDEHGEVRADSFVSCMKDWGGCGHVKRNLRLTEAFVLAAVERRLARVGEFAEPDDSEDAAETARLTAEYERLTAEVAALQEAYLAGDLTSRDFVPMVGKLRARLDETERLLDDRPQVRPTLGPDPATAWRDGDFAERRELLEAVVETVVLAPIGNHGPAHARRMVPERTDIRWR